MSNDQIYLAAAIVASVTAILGASIGIVRFLTESYRTVAAGRLEEIKELKIDLTDQSETLVELADRMHGAEKEILEREKIIAELQARPDTDQMLRLFQQHHDENQALLKPALEGIQKANEALYLLLDRNRERRSTDPE